MKRSANPERRSSRPPGFTLIEMMVVLTLFCIIAGLSWPSFSSLKVKARRSEARAALLQAMQQQERHYTANGSYAEFSRGAPNGFAWHSGLSPAGSSHELQAEACAGASLEECVQITATPGTQSVNANAADAQCAALSLNSRGERGSGGDATLCWQ
jgi:type IV pilus assembly protein PilE